VSMFKVNLTANEVLEACNVVRMVAEYLVSLPFSLRQSFFSRRWLCSSVASLMCPSFAKTYCQLTSWISELRRVGIWSRVPGFSTFDIFVSWKKSVIRPTSVVLPNSDGENSHGNALVVNWFYLPVKMWAYNKALDEIPFACL
jgi:hypothetical protein